MRLQHGFARAPRNNAPCYRGKVRCSPGRRSPARSAAKACSGRAGSLIKRHGRRIGIPPARKLCFEYYNANLVLVNPFSLAVRYSIRRSPGCRRSRAAGFQGFFRRRGGILLRDCGDMKYSRRRVRRVSKSAGLLSRNARGWYARPQNRGATGAALRRLLTLLPETSVSNYPQRDEGISIFKKRGRIGSMLPRSRAKDSARSLGARKGTTVYVIGSWNETRPLQLGRAPPALPG